MALGTRRTPERNNPLFSGIVIDKRPVTPFLLTSANTPLTLTTAQLLMGLLPVDCRDTGTLTLPTAAQIVAAVPGIEVGSSFEIEVINFGDSTATLAVGTGITNKSYGEVAKVAVLAITTLVSARYRLVCTGVKAQGSTSDSFDLYGFGVIAAAVA